MLKCEEGSVWYQNYMSLNYDFDLSFNVFLGNNCTQGAGAGADGIAFVLQPLSTGAGSTGGGLGYAGISPSIDVEYDTYQNDGTLITIISLYSLTVMIILMAQILLVYMHLVTVLLMVTGTAQNLNGITLHIH